MHNRYNGGFRRFLSFLGIIIFTIFIGSTRAVAADAKNGAALFKKNCGSCHFVTDKPSTGPGLAGVVNRVPQPSEEWLLKWIKNNVAVINSGEKYANTIKTFAPTEMTIFDWMEDGQIKDIIEYLKNPAAVDPPPTTTGTTTTGEPVAKEEGNAQLYIILSILVFLVILIAVLRNVNRGMRNLINAKQGEPEIQDGGFWNDAKIWINGHKFLVTFLLILLLAGGSKWVWDELFAIGVYEGYKPEQPIKFSHKLHAGDNAIACQYCHGGVEKSKTAGIPPVSVCMNCHKSISKGPTTGETEIAKIYEAAGWDGAAYTKEQKPLKWNKVHVLPDFVFFSHQQHVVVGKQDCATCHGDMKQETVAKQNMPLTMGWCIDCHRKTEVPGMMVDDKTGKVSNAYYEELHKKLAAKYHEPGDKKITVDRMGGIECGKCHY